MKTTLSISGRISLLVMAGCSRDGDGTPATTPSSSNVPDRAGTDTLRSRGMQGKHWLEAIAQLEALASDDGAQRTPQRLLFLIGLHPEKVMTIHNGSDEPALRNDARADPDLRSHLGIPGQAAVRRSPERPLRVDEAVRQDVGYDDRLYGRLYRHSSTTQADYRLQ